MLRQVNFQITRPRKRKLYTPTSDDEENIIIQKSPEKVKSTQVKINEIKFNEKRSGTALIKEIRVKELDPVEIAENMSWTMIKPVINRHPVMFKSIWSNYLRFNSPEKANRMKFPKIEKFEVNYQQIMNVLMTCSTNNKGQSSIQNKPDNDNKREKSGHSSKNQFNTVVNIQQPVNGHSIKTISSEINCGTLNMLFQQHEIFKEHPNLECIQVSFKDDFIASQFVSNTKINLKDESTTDSMNHSKILFDPNQILNDWLKGSQPNRNSTESSEEFSTPAMLSESGKKIQHQEFLSKCFL